MSLAQYTALSGDSPATTSGNNGVQANRTSDNSADALQNEFLTLMVAQIQNQDPLNPLDGTEYVGQLAQFSQVQSTENMSKMMQNSMVLMDNMQVLATAGLVGQTVYVSTNEMTLGEGTQSGKIELAHASNQVNLLLEDDYGRVTKVPLGAHGAGDVDFTIDPEALELPEGNYTVSVEVQSGQTEPKVLLAGQVEQVRVPSNGGSALVNVAGVGSIPFYQISQFGS
ncbi:flagellar hook assembly protein FlgD [Photobacterium sp. WH77]|uniref:Basal-body rod modification protein FlgD n=1 Tax=Photobacterium arenosum TaxID=2774143 RepID=A0ABR9BMW7_9GAMM|nr:MULTISPECIES: flagellar hook assembly protein FlgD [Photobacterium]MBD8513837.1 flagellar hook assembly protein FlgD [Photobacterium arenosum]MBV7262522.1 flagellar hook assembly protein FlgD [Photobacterium sp. WH24]MCG2836412.1 flagellar hook assembly protein FlgD [Photobacterium sp. WH77]MCG2843961.1 flagellar hook assembly protein FlgD [Photobacterium sp. WH80]MDO6583445.1 flagellar hook assembly protein FlgD [Photobacterium sp. 2_MG-2023]